MFIGILKIPFESVSDEFISPVADQLQLTATFFTGRKALSTRRASTDEFVFRYSRGTVFNSKSVVPTTEMLT